MTSVLTPPSSGYHLELVSSFKVFTDEQFKSHRQVREETRRLNKQTNEIRLKTNKEKQLTGSGDKTKA